MYEKFGRNCFEVYIYGLMNFLWGSIVGENNLIFSFLYDGIVGVWIEGKIYIKDIYLNNMLYFKIIRFCKRIINKYMLKSYLGK